VFPSLARLRCHLALPEPVAPVGHGFKHYGDGVARLGPKVTFAPCAAPWGERPFTSVTAEDENGRGSGLPTEIPSAEPARGHGSGRTAAAVVSGGATVA